MIIGDGDIASAIRDRADRVYFASGVSNSQETREYQYKMEADLLLSQPKDKRLVYFSSLSIFYADTRYAQHKRYMERLVKLNFPNYCIVRLGNITWGKNPHTLINAMRKQLLKGESLDIRNVYRYLIDRKEFRHWLDLIPEFNAEMNIPGKMMKVKQIVDKYIIPF